MPQAALVGIDSVGGGTILGGGQDFVRCDGALLVVQGDAIQNHGPGPHTAPTMLQGSSFVKIDGPGVCLAGDLATCFHLATGSGFLVISE